MERNRAIDIAKGIGIFFVIWAHTICPIKQQIYVFHIPLFFLLSGFLFNDNDEIKIVIKKKIKSLGIPFLFFLLIQRIGYILVYLIEGTFKTSYLLLWNPVPIRGVIGVLWFILALLIVTVGYGFINKIRSSLWRFIICFGLTFIGYLLHKINLRLPLHFDSSLSMIFFFFLGNWFSKIELCKNNSVMIWIPAFILSTALYVFLLEFYLPSIDIVTNTFEGNFLFTVGMIILGCLTVLSVSKIIDLIPLIDNGLAYVGKNSLTIFATHTIFLQAIYLAYPKNTVSNFGGVSISIIVLVVCLLVNLVLQKYFPFVFGREDIFVKLITLRKRFSNSER